MYCHAPADHYASSSIVNNELQRLLQSSQLQVRNYVTRSSREHSACTEMVARAAAGDDDALDALISLSIPYIHAKA